MGRLTDIVGGYYVFVGALIWYTIWSLIAGFSQNYPMLIVCRAMQGFGPAAYLPSGVMLLGRIYRPGPRKNLIFFLYGAFSPIGFFTGIFFAGLSGQYLPWNWFFYLGTILLFIVTGVAILTIPSDRAQRHSTQVKMDWLGAALIVPGLSLVVFALTDSSHAPAHWDTPYICITFVLGSLCLSAAFYVEGWVAEMPLLPFEIFKIKHMKPLALSLFFSYGVFGLYLFYASFYIEDILRATALQTVAWFAPMAGGGVILAAIGGLILHRLPGTVLLILSASGYVVCVLLFAIMPDNPSYWAYIFPAMVSATVGVDIAYSVSNVFITTSMTSKQQGLAGAFINSLYFLGVSFFLGLADIAAAGTVKHGLKHSYKVVFWFGVACAVVALILLVGFVKIDAATSDLTADEKAELEIELRRTPVSPSVDGHPIQNGSPTTTGRASCSHDINVQLSRST
jgi:MFS family permease